MPDAEAREIYHLTVTEELASERLDVAIVKLVGDLSRTRAQNMIREGFVLLDGKKCDIPRFKVEAGMTIDVDAPAQQITTKAEPESIPLNVMFEDESILVVDKPAGMVVHPAAGNWSGTLVNALLGREPDLLEDDYMDPLRPGIVHRLDKDTSGALVIAKTPKALRKLSKMFAEREVEKTYLAIVHGWPLPTSAVIRTPFGRHPVDHKKMCVPRIVREDDEFREAVTAYTVIKSGYRNGQKVSVVKVRLHTGRTHQIRVHMAYKDCPLLGEKLYNKGRSPYGVPRQMLHAWQLSFVHPLTGEELDFEAPLPADFEAVLDEITDEK